MIVTHGFESPMWDQNDATNVANKFGLKMNELVKETTEWTT